jgi:hypothetical protein
MSPAPAFDIFRIEADGALVWCEAASTLAIAKLRIRALAAASPAPSPYMIRDTASGTQTAIAPDNFPGASPQRPKPLGDLALRPYHICRIEKDRLRWIEPAESLDAAAARIKILTAFSPGEYLVLDYNPELRSRWPPPAFLSL